MGGFRAPRQWGGFPACSQELRVRDSSRVEGGVGPGSGLSQTDACPRPALSTAATEPQAGRAEPYWENSRRTGAAAHRGHFCFAGVRPARRTSPLCRGRPGQLCPGSFGGGGWVGSGRGRRPLRPAQQRASPRPDRGTVSAHGDRQPADLLRRRASGTWERAPRAWPGVGAWSRVRTGLGWPGAGVHGAPQAVSPCVWPRGAAPRSERRVHTPSSTHACEEVALSPWLGT